MLSKVFLAILAASPLVAAHGKVAVLTGDAGGNTTGLGIQGGVIPGAGTNKETEVDTTVFQSKQAASDGLGKTKAGPNTLADMTNVMAASGSVLPQVSQGGSISGTMHIVTTDGAGPYTAIVDPTGTGAFSSGTELEVTQQVPGRNGNIRPPQQRRFISRMLVKMGIVKRAANVNEDYPFSAKVPAGMTCTGTVAGQSGVCLVKIVNPSNAGPFGGVIAMQMASTNTTSNSPAAASAAPAAPNTEPETAKPKPALTKEPASSSESSSTGGTSTKGTAAEAPATAGKTTPLKALVGAKFRA